MDSWSGDRDLMAVMFRAHPVSLVAYWMVYVVGYVYWWTVVWKTSQAGAPEG